MLYAQIYAVFIEKEEEFVVEAPSNFAVVLVKLPCVIALHLALSPEIDNALQIMKFAN